MCKFVRSLSQTKMFAFATVLAVASAALPTALAHGGVLAYSNAGNWYQGW